MSQSDHTQIEDIISTGPELSEEHLRLVAGGMRGSSIVIDIPSGASWSDRDF